MNENNRIAEQKENSEDYICPGCNGTIPRPYFWYAVQEVVCEHCLEVVNVQDGRRVGYHIPGFC